MDREFQEIEDALKALRPAAAPGAGFERFAAAMEGRLQLADPALRAIEQELSRFRPVAPAAALEEVLLETVSRVPFPLDEKVVMFPGAAKVSARPAPAAKSPRTWWMAAAAVAVAGAFSALMVDGGAGRHSASPGVARNSLQSPAGSPLPSPNTASRIVPASTTFHEATNEGVLWNERGEPFRVVNVVYIDRVEIPGPDGRMMVVERPRVEKIMVPEKVD